MVTKFIDNHTFNEIKVGQTASLERTLTRDNMALFSATSGDHILAPIDGCDNMDMSYNMWLGSLLSSLLGNNLPGPGTVYLQQHLEFQGAVHLGDSVTVSVVVKIKHEDTGTVELECIAVNQKQAVILKGIAVVQAPQQKMRIATPALPDVHVTQHDGFSKLFKLTSKLQPVKTVIVHPCSVSALEGAIEAAEEGLITPILVGPEKRIIQLAEENSLSLADYQIINVEHSHAAAQKSIELIRSGEANLLMKGSLHTDELMSAVVSSRLGIRTERRLSHVFVMDVPSYSKLLFITDAAINIAPDLDAKRDICQNAIDLAHTLGVELPKVAILSAVEVVDRKIPSTIEAAALCKMADRGQITSAILDGPLAMDNAISMEAAKIKGIKSEVAGDADILIAPDLESGNMLAKQLTFLSDAEAGGVVLGARVPIILTSRADSVRSRKASCAIAVAHAHAISLALALPVA
ncbi:MAG: bifunctional enoyl-CoA hydratase/phosphate acetyltransferase [Colwellia sp.]